MVQAVLNAQRRSAVDHPPPATLPVRCSGISGVPRFRGRLNATPRRPWSADRTFAELLIDCEEDRTLRAVLVGMLRESQRP